MAFFHAVARFGRADLSFLVFAAFFAFCVAPQTGASASLHPQNVLLWLSSGEVSPEVRETGAQTPPFPAPPIVSANPVFSLPIAVSKTPTCTLEASVLARLNGVRTNRRLL